MKKIGVAAGLVACLIWALTAVEAAESTRPPKNLKKVGDHWTPWDPPPAGPEDYIIVPRDTLWDLSQKWLGDPLLWPQIWDQNRYILDSHWIYPGDPLVVPGRPTVVPPDGPPPGEELSGQPPGTGTGDSQPQQPEAIRLVPLADETDLYCSGFITPERREVELMIAGRETEREALGEGDVIFLNQGRDRGLAAGDQFAILRQARDVEHPITGEDLGVFVRRLGRARVMLAHATTSTAMIEMSCEDVRTGDELVPWVEIPVPMTSGLPTFDRYNPEPSGGAQGYLVTLQDALGAAGAGHMIYVDIAGAQGARPGEFLTLYRPGVDELPRINLGQAVVLTVEPNTSTAKILYSVKEVLPGDRAELVR
jgi:hypothetical protein